MGGSAKPVYRTKAKIKPAAGVSACTRLLDNAAKDLEGRVQMMQDDRERVYRTCRATKARPLT